MNILQICSKIPYSPKDGGSIAMNILTHGLIDCGNNVDVLAVNTPKHFVKDQDVSEDYKEKTNYQSVFIDTDIKPFDAFINLFSSKSYNVIRFYSKDFESVLADRLKTKDYDIIQLETLWVTPYINVIRKYSTAKVVLRSQNIEYMIWERLAQDSSSFFKKSYMNLLAKRLKKFEVSEVNKYDAILTITPLDTDVYIKHGCKCPILHVPFGIDITKYKIDTSELQKPSIFHIGAMDWRPNADGLNWFLKNVWQDVAKTNKNIKLYLAGRNMPEWLKELRMENVVVEGEVPDAHKFINSKSIMIVPLASGGGMRVKIIEGMALGKTIISTAVGAEGIDYSDGENIIIANTAKEFVDAINKCIIDQSFADGIAKNGEKLARTKYDNQVICNNLTAFYKELLA